MRKLFYLLVATLSIASCKNLCHNEDCQNGGTCVKGECWCREGYKGEFCEIETRAAMLGTYKGAIKYNDNTTDSNVVVTIARTDANIEGSVNYKKISVTITPSLKYHYTYYCTASDEYNFSVQNNKNGTQVLGSINNETLTLLELYPQSSTSYNTATFTGVKQ